MREPLLLKYMNNMHISCFHKTSIPTMSALELTVVKVKKKFDLNTE